MAALWWLLVSICLPFVACDYSTCFDTPQGNVNRSAVAITLASHSWRSHELSSFVAEIVLRELLGFTVLRSYPDNAKLWGQDIAAGLYDIDVEQWHVDSASDDFAEFVTDSKQVLVIGEVGYTGRSGLFTFRSSLGRSQYADYYKFYQNSSEALRLGFPGYQDSQLEPILGDSFPVCDPLETVWCGAGDWLGYWAPSACELVPCVEIFKAYPTDDVGYFEQLIQESSLQAFFGYYGEKFLELLENSVGQPVLFHATRPSVEVAKFDLARISFEDYSPGCDSGDTGNPLTGNTYCDRPESLLQKVVSGRTRESAPEAVLFLSLLQISEEDMNDILLSTASGGGPHLTTFDAACGYLRANMDQVQRWTPPCIRNPVNVDEGEVERFNAELLTCENVTVLGRIEPFHCPGGRVGTVDRSRQTVRLVKRDWLTQVILIQMVEVVLRDHLGYNVEVVTGADRRTADVYEDIVTDLFHVEIESWWFFFGDTLYKSYIEPGRVVFAGNTGFLGDQGFWIPKTAVDANPESSSLIAYYKYYKNATLAAADGFLRHGDSPLYNVTDRLCTQALQHWCGAGSLEGFYVPYACRNNTADCLEIVASSPRYAEGYYEQVVNNLGIEAVFAYYGFGAQFDWMASYTERGVFPLFYWWTPDTNLFRLDAMRVSLPDTESSCASPSADRTPDGAGACEYPPVWVAKLVAPHIKNNLPEAFYALKQFQFFQSDWDVYLPAHVAAGGSRSSEELVCDILLANEERLRAWAPDCMVSPPAPEDALVNDSFFSAVQGECVAVTCPRNMVLNYRQDTSSFLCDLCPLGDVPDAIQKHCEPCPMGTRVSDDQITCEPCLTGRYSLSRSSECLPCAAGSFANTTGSSACLACLSGTHQAATGGTACLDCSLGRVAAETGMSTCLECTSGTTAAATGMSVCEDCPVGRYQRERGESLCLECQPGRIARELGSFTCTECFQGFFQENRSATACERCQLGKFAPVVASTACNTCAYGTTDSTAAGSANDCQCPSGTFLRNEECVECQLKYMDCPGGDAPAMQKRGYAVSADAVKVFRCSSEEACPGGRIGTCPIGSSGIACAECQDREYGWNGTHCEKCTAAQSYLIVLLSFLLVSALVAIHYFGNDPVSLSFSMTSEFIVLVGLLANVVLALNSFSGFDVKWQEPLKALLEFCQLLATEVSQVRLGCSVSFSHVAQYMLSSLVPGVVGVVLMVLPLMHLASPRKLFNTYATLAYSLYLLLVMHAVKPFRFIVHPASNGKSVLDIPAVLSGTDEHAALVLGGILVLLIYCLPFAVVCVVATISMKRTPKGAQRRWWLMSFRFLFYKFRPSYHYWGLCILLRSAVYALAPIIAPANPKIGLFLLSIMAATNSAHTAMANPWRYTWMTITDVAIQCYILLFLQLAFGWVDESDFADNFLANVLMAVAGFAVILGTSVFLQKLFHVLLLSHEQKQLRREKEHFLAQEYMGMSPEARKTEVADALDDIYEQPFYSTQRVKSLEERVSHCLLQVSHKSTEIGYYGDIAESLNDPEYTLQHFYEDCLRAMPELLLYDLEELEAEGRRASREPALPTALDNGRTKAEEKLRTIGALFAVYCLCRLNIDGKEILSFGVDERKPHIVKKPPSDVTKESLDGIPWGKMTPMQRRASFYWTFDWDLLENLCIQAGILVQGDNQQLTLDTRPDGRLVAMLCLTAFHDIMKDTSLCPVVYGQAYENYEPGERIHDHDMALAYFLDRHPELLPSFRILSAEQRKLVRFTQSEMGFNAGWLVQAEGPPSAVLKRLKKAIASGGAQEADVAFYFVHWVTDLAGAEPTPFAGSEKFAAKFPPFVLQGLLGCFSVVKMLADHSETEVYEAYLVKRWKEAAAKSGEKTLAPPIGHEAMAQMRLLCMAQGAADEVLQAYHEMPDEDRQYLSRELAETGMPGQEYQGWQDAGPGLGTPFLLYYGPAWCQRAGQSHPKLTLRILKKVFRLAREAYPESRDTSKDAEEDISCRTIQVGLLKTLDLDALDAEAEGLVLQIHKESRLEGKVDTANVYEM